MGLFRRKKKDKPQEEREYKSIAILGDDEMKEALKSMTEIPSSCPEIMQATNTCYCPGCENVGRCVIERMSRSVGCVGSFPVYCSTRDGRKDEPTYGWGHIILRNIMPEIQAKYGIKETEGVSYAKKKASGDAKRRPKRSDNDTT